MKFGNWVPIAKAFVKYLPSGRPYSKVEAIFALQVDFDNQKTGTITGYSKQWQWGKKKVYSFFKEIGIELKKA